MAEEDAVVPADLSFMLVPAHGGTFLPHVVQVRSGRFHVDAIPPGNYWPEFDGLPSSYALIRDGHALGLFGAAEITFVVTSKAGTVVASVRDADGPPVKGATVELFPDTYGDDSGPMTNR